MPYATLCLLLSRHPSGLREGSSLELWILQRVVLRMLLKVDNDKPLATARRCLRRAMIDMITSPATWSSGAVIVLFYDLRGYMDKCKVYPRFHLAFCSARLASKLGSPCDGRPRLESYYHDQHLAGLYNSSDQGNRCIASFPVTRPATFKSIRKRISSSVVKLGLRGITCALQLPVSCCIYLLRHRLKGREEVRSREDGEALCSSARRITHVGNTNHLNSATASKSHSSPRSVFCAKASQARERRGLHVTHISLSPPIRPSSRGSKNHLYLLNRPPSSPEISVGSMMKLADPTIAGSLQEGQPTYLAKGRLTYFPPPYHPECHPWQPS
ncbi:hypothetical protein BJV77DRAFT_964551 [Russula vinacea]|nr:hypothetical protein BJV77DRAFT_964551 [Russula vinacea]